MTDAGALSVKSHEGPVDVFTIIRICSSCAPAPCYAHGCLYLVYFQRQTQLRHMHAVSYAIHGDVVLFTLLRPQVRSSGAVFYMRALLLMVEYIE